MLLKKRARRAAGAGAGLVAALLALVVGSGVEAQTSPEPGACAACHDPDAVLRARVLPHAESTTCLDCHHIGSSTDPAVIARLRLEACESCHETEAATAVHGFEQDATCLSCHTIHGAAPMEWSEGELSGQCESCHGSPHTLHAEVEDADAPLCTACHDLHAIEAPESTPEAPVYAGTSASEVTGTCVSCHETVHPSHPADGPDAVTCTSCHGLNAERPIAESPERVAATCASCHEDAHTTHIAVDDADAPGCVDCHTFADDPPMEEVSARTMADRCGACHEAELEAYLSGGHAQGVLAEELSPGVPTCTTCHMDVLRDEGGAPDRLGGAEGCIACHSDPELAEDYGLSTNVVDSYLEDYHGATLSFLLDEADVQVERAEAILTCADCHGNHSVGWSEEEVMADICLDCHEEADPDLAGAWLGHGPPGPDSQVMTWLVGLFYYFLIPFMLIGLGLIIVYEAIHAARHGARPWKAEGTRLLWAKLTRKGPKPEMVPRFSLRERIEHFATSSTFIILVVTGLPQLRPDLEIAHSVIALFGGIESTRLIHRIFGFTLTALLVIHVGTAVIRAIRKRRMPVMLPTLEDFDHAVATVQHWVRGTPKPKIGKFDFAQKFEYGGMLMGTVVMVGTGLVLIYPDTVSFVIPGEWVAAMRAMHGYEATFATLVVLLWHSWGVILRPEVFPLDTSIFTGKITKHRLKNEHWLEYERMFPEEAAEEAARTPGLEPPPPEPAEEGPDLRDDREGSDR